MKKIITKIINATSVIIIVIAVAILLIVITTPKGKSPNIFGFSVFRVMTGSMEPSIETGALIVTKRVAMSEIKEGDIISFYSNDPALGGSVNTHRVSKIDSEEDKVVIYTKGDANNIEDRYPVYEENLIGLVTGSSKRMGSLVSVLSNPIVFIPVILGPLLIIIILNIIKTIKLAGKLAAEEEEKERQELVEHVKKLQNERKKKE